MSLLLRPELGLKETAHVLLTAWRAITQHVPFAGLVPDLVGPAIVEGRCVEVALLDRRAAGPVHYRKLDFHSFPR